MPISPHLPDLAHRPEFCRTILSTPPSLSPFFFRSCCVLLLVSFSAAYCLLVVYTTGQLTIVPSLFWSVHCCCFTVASNIALVLHSEVASFFFPSLTWHL